MSNRRQGKGQDGGIGVTGMTSPPHSEIVSNQVGTFWRLARRYWSGVTGPRAFLLSIAVLALVVLNLRVQVAVNTWNKDFFDALDAKRMDLLPELLWSFAWLAFASTVVAAVLVIAKMLLHIGWRLWVSQQVLDRWLGKRAYESLSISGRDRNAPEYRIADDVKLAIEPLVELATGFLGVWLVGVTFIRVLASVGGGIEVPLFGGFYMPGYFVVAAFVYALVMSGSTWIIGWPLVRAIEAKNQQEGQFRYELTTFRENAQLIVRQGSERARHESILQALTTLVQRWYGVMRGLTRVTLVGNTNAMLVGVVPLLLGAPKYMAGQMSLGEVMQVAAAFVQVQLALNWIVDNFVRVAEWRASANRVGQLIATIDGVDKETGQASSPAEDAGAVGAAAGLPAAALSDPAR